MKKNLNNIVKQKSKMRRFMYHIPTPPSQPRRRIILRLSFSPASLNTLSTNGQKTLPRKKKLWPKKPNRFPPETPQHCPWTILLERRFQGTKRPYERTKAARVWSSAMTLL
jgi:hypothetical protein